MKKNDPQNPSRLLEIAIIFLGIGALILGFLNLKKTVVSTVMAPSQSKNSASPSSLQEIINKQNKDTDGDGLSDYDEENVYHTSIYLADTDSDGLSDGEEVKLGKDPNCPEGKDCSVKESAPSSQRVNPDIEDLIKAYTGEMVGGTSKIESNLSPGSATSTKESNSQYLKFISGQATPQEIREILISQGAPSEELNKIPDDVIMETYKEMLSNNQ